MALIDEVRFALRITTSTNTSLNTELQRYINAAILDLTQTTDIKNVTDTTTDALLKDAIITYACFMFERDVNRKNNYKAVYDDFKTKLMTSGHYNGGRDNDETP